MTNVDSDMIKNSIQGPGLFKEALNSITMDATFLGFPSFYPW